MGSAPGIQLNIAFPNKSLYPISPGLPPDDIRRYGKHCSLYIDLDELSWFRGPLLCAPTVPSPALADTLRLFFLFQLPPVFTYFRGSRAI